MNEKKAVLLLISYDFLTINFLQFFVSVIFDKPSTLRNKLKFFGITSNTVVINSLNAKSCHYVETCQLTCSVALQLTSFSMMASLAFNDLVLMNLQKMKIKIKMSEKFKSTFNKDIVLSGTISLNWLFTVFLTILNT